VINAPERRAKALAAVVFFGMTMSQILGPSAGQFSGLYLRWRVAFAVWSVLLLRLPSWGAWSGPIVPRGLSFSPVNPARSCAVMRTKTDAGLWITASFLMAGYVVNTFLAPRAYRQGPGLGRQTHFAGACWSCGIGAVAGNINRAP